MLVQSNHIKNHRILHLKKHDYEKWVGGMMNIAIVGLGFVGLSLTSVLASKGYRTVGIDVDIEKCKKISNGFSPFFEPYLERTLRSGLKKKLTIF